MKNTYLNAVFQQIKQVSHKVKQDFGDLSVTQLNWKPNPKSWSIAQCLEHLNNTAEVYYPKIDALASANYQPNMFERIHLFSGFFGNLLLGFTSPEIKKKTKTLKPFEPSTSNISAEIIERFQEEHQTLIRKMKALDKLDHKNTYLSSPAGNFITYNVHTLCTLLGNHTERHYAQAMNVMQHERFPK